MWQIALKMLFYDRVKYLGLILGVSISILLINQQVGVFLGLLLKAGAIIRDIPEAGIWVMDPGLKNMDTIFPMRDTELGRVRGVAGVEWAVPYFKSNATIRTPYGNLESSALFGVDDNSLIGIPSSFVMGSAEALRQPEAVAIGRDGYERIWPGQPLHLGQILELNDHRAVLRAIVVDSPKFTNTVSFYTRYSQALSYTNNGRRQMSFILVKARPGTSDREVAQQIAKATGLLALTSSEFSWKMICFVFLHTGIPVSIGTVILLGVLVGFCIVGLLFNLFVVENLRHFAVLKAIGTTNRRLLGMVLLQASVAGAVGYGIGLGLAALFFECATRSPNFRGFYLPWQVALASGVIAAGIILLSALWAMRRVLRVEPGIVFRG
jgi:putative ABC transport system permease protein